MAAVGVGVLIASGSSMSLPGASGGSAFASATVNGGGSSFAAPEALQWATDVAGPPDHLTINYTNSSSGNGRLFYGNGEWDYGTTDIIYNAEDQGLQNTVPQTHPFKYVTISAGGLAFEYNVVVDGVKFTNLELTRRDVCQIFTGQVTNWNQLAATAPSDAPLASLNLPITPVVRSDSAGESYVLSQYCQAVDPGDWNTFKNWVDSTNDGGAGYSDPNMPAGLPVSYWPGNLNIKVGLSTLTASGAPAEAQDADDPNVNGAIGYVATAYALQLGAPVASVQNGAGVFTVPTPNSIQIALSYASANSVGTFNLDFTGSSAQAYFPSTYSYVLDPTNTNTPDSGINGPLNEWLCYDVGQGQNEAAPLDYAPLSKQVTQLSVDAIEATPDAPPASQCGIGGPQPDLIAPGKVTPVATGPSSGFPGSSNGGGTTTPGAVGNGSGSGGSGGSGGTNGLAGSAGGTSGSGGSTGSSTGGSGAGSATRSKGGALAGSRGVGSQLGGSNGATRPGSGSQGSLQASGIETVSQSGPSSSPAPDQALWWVLGGFVLAAGATGITGLTRREKT
jgi:ABC-type phosphate transport system substrate-binding protein